MRQLWKGVGKVFAFTFRSKWNARLWRVATILIAVLVFVLPAGILPLVELSSGQPSVEESSPVTRVFVADETGAVPLDWEELNLLAPEGYDGLRYVLCDSLEQARQQAEEHPNDSAILLVESGQSGLTLTLLSPENAGYQIEELAGLEQFFSANSQWILLGKAGLSQEQMAALTAPVQSTQQVQGENGETLTPVQQQIQLVRMVFSIVLPFVLLMVLYFMVLFYGQGVANQVLMEKNAKLMDTLLLAVRPTSLVLGKVLALVCASLFQLCLWTAALVGGFGLGCALVKSISPATQNPLVLFLDSLGQLEGVFSPGGWILALLLLAGGFLLYCSLAAIGGAVAGKPEDLSSTNLLFTMALVVSFFCVLYGGGMTLLGSGSGEDWMNWIPFTAILVTPSRLLLGQVPLWVGACSLALTLLCSLLLLWLAGRVYRLMALYKGNPPSLGRVLGMLRREK